jgi:hypothetical protein
MHSTAPARLNRQSERSERQSLKKGFLRAKAASLCLRIVRYFLAVGLSHVSEHRERQSVKKGKSETGARFQKEIIALRSSSTPSSPLLQALRWRIRLDQ